MFDLFNALPTTKKLLFINSVILGVIPLIMAGSREPYLFLIIIFPSLILAAGLIILWWAWFKRRADIIKVAFWNAVLMNILFLLYGFAIAALTIKSGFHINSIVMYLPILGLLGVLFGVWWVFWFLTGHALIFRTLLIIVSILATLLFLYSITLESSVYSALIIFGMVAYTPLAIVWIIYALGKRNPEGRISKIFPVFVIIMTVLTLSLLTSFLPLWNGCGQRGCFPTSFWMSDYFVIYD